MPSSFAGDKTFEEPFKQGGNPGNEVLFQAYPHEYSLIKKAKETLDKTMFFDYKSSKENLVPLTTPRGSRRHFPSFHLFLQTFKINIR